MTSPLSAIIHGLGRGLVMDELDAWSADSVEELVPAQRRPQERVIDLVELPTTVKRAS